MDFWFAALELPEESGGAFDDEALVDVILECIVLGFAGLDVAYFVFGGVLVAQGGFVCCSEEEDPRGFDRKI